MRKAIGVFCFILTTLLSFPAWADGAGERETLALQSCLDDHPNAEQYCFNVPYYTCMGTMLGIAPNPTSAKNICLFQEFEVWNNLVNEACDQFKLVFEENSREWRRICTGNFPLFWSDILSNYPESTGHGVPSQSLKLSAQGIRSFAVEMRLALKLLK